MAANDRILAVDIGGDSLKIVEYHYPSEERVVLEKFAFVKYGGGIDDDELLESLEERFKDAIIENGFTAKNVYLSVSGQNSFTKFVKLPPVGDDESRLRQIVEFEAKQNVPFPMDEVVWDYQLISTDDEDDGDSEMEVMFVVVKNEQIENITRIIESAGLTVQSVETAPTACYNSARANEIGQDESHMILNIGGRCSSLIFIDNGRFFVRTILIAGYTITQRIAKEFGISFADAEEMKQRHGFVALGGAYEEPDSEVAATVSKIVRNVMTRLHGEINRSINVYRSQQKGRKPTKLFLAGGSAVMAYTPRFFSEKLRIPVEYFNPFQVVSIGADIDKEKLAGVAHMFSETIGLGLRYAIPCPIEISLLPDELKKKHEIKQKSIFFYASAMALICCLATLYFGATIQKRYYQELTKFASQHVQQTAGLKGEIKYQIDELDSLRRKYKKAEVILKKRSEWINILNETQSIIPDNIWLTSFVVSDGTPPVKGASTQRTRSSTRMGGMFSRSSAFSHSSRKVVTKERIWMVLKGHTLRSAPGVANPMEKLTDNVIKSKLFTDKIADIRVVSNPRNENLSTFEVWVKLKKVVR
jgi:type IV pilus assembly protein PilM